MRIRLVRDEFEVILQPGLQLCEVGTMVLAIVALAQFRGQHLVKRAFHRVTFAYKSDPLFAGLGSLRQCIGVAHSKNPNGLDSGGLS